MPTCRDVDAAPMSRPRDWATRAVDVDKAIKSRYRLASGGCSVIQYTILQYIIGHITYERDVLLLICMSMTMCVQPFKYYLEWNISHGLSQVIGLQAVPVVEMFPYKHRHLQGNCGTTAVLQRHSNFIGKIMRQIKVSNL